MRDEWRSSGQFVQLLSGCWTLAVLGQLADGSLRYQDLDDAVDGISHKVLTETFHRVEREGLVTRHLDPGMSRPPPSTNSPTSVGRSTSLSQPSTVGPTEPAPCVESQPTVEST